MYGHSTTPIFALVFTTLHPLSVQANRVLRADLWVHSMSQHIHIAKHDGYAIITMAKEPVNRCVVGVSRYLFVPTYAVLEHRLCSLLAATALLTCARAGGWNDMHAQQGCADSALLAVH
jgi:hypothetical protein